MRVFPKIGVPPKSSILIGFSITNHPFWGTPVFGNIHEVKIQQRVSCYFVVCAFFFSNPRKTPKKWTHNVDTADLRIFWYLHTFLTDLLRIDLGQFRRTDTNHGHLGIGFWWGERMEMWRAVGLIEKEWHKMYHPHMTNWMDDFWQFYFSVVGKFPLFLMIWNHV